MRISSGLPPAVADLGAPRPSLEVDGSAEGFLILVAALLETGLAEAAPALPGEEPAEAPESDEGVTAIPPFVIPPITLLQASLVAIDAGVPRTEGPAAALPAQVAPQVHGTDVAAGSSAEVQLDALALPAAPAAESAENATSAAPPVTEKSDAAAPPAEPARPLSLVAPALESQLDLLAATAPARLAADGGGRELGSKETDGGVGEAGRPDPSAPSPLPPSRPTEAPVRETASRPQPDLDRLLRQQEMRPQPVVDGGDMRLELAPEGLGPIEVRVAVRADAVHARLVADHEHTRHALEAQRPSLEAALGRSQLRLEGFSVGLGQHREPAPREELPPRGPRPPILAASVAPPPPRRALGAGGQLSLHA